MNYHQERVLQSFRRVQGWFAANQDLVSADTASGPALATQLDHLEAIVHRATDHATQQDTQQAESLLISKDEREQRKEVLSYHMASIARVARALRGTVPGIGVLTIPKGNIQSAALITAASVMARKSEIYAQVLSENGLPTDFVRQLEAAAARLKASLDARGLARGARAAATRGLEAELALGRRIVEIMDVSLTRILRTAPSKLAEWKHVKRVTQRGSAGRGGGNVAEDSPTLLSGSTTARESGPTLVQDVSTGVQPTPIVVSGSAEVVEKAA